MLTAEQKNLCWRIAMGYEKENNLKKPLTKEEKEEVEDDREEIKFYKENGLKDILDAMSFDE